MCESTWYKCEFGRAERFNSVHRSTMVSIGSKREWDVSEIEEGKDVYDHGIPLQVSPVKESRMKKGVRYFDARLSDGKKVRLQAAMKKAEETESVVALVNSNVMKSSVNYELEVHLNKHSQVTSSPRKLELGDAVCPFTTTNAVKIADIVDLAVNEAVEVTCKVEKLKEVKIVKKKSGARSELRIQDVVIGDETKSCRLVLWEGEVNSVEEGKSYRFVGVGVRKYGVKYLAYTANSSKEVVEDVENVNEEEIGGEEDEDDSGRTVEGEITAVISSSEYLSCKFCRSKAVASDELVAECSKCNAVMKVSCCEKTKAAKFVVTDESGHDTTLSTFEPVLSKIAGSASGSSLAHKLTRASRKVFRYNDRNVVFSAQDM